MRKSVEDTWRFLESAGEQPPRHSDGLPVIRDRMPSFDDQGPLGFSYYKYRLEDADNSNLSLPRTFFGRSLLARVSFAESRMCWNDFEDCDFSRADLSGCDMRASHFRGCKFVGAVLQGADLRRSSFEDCDFAEAVLADAVAQDGGAIGCVQDYLTDDQQAVVAWGRGFRP